MIYSKIKYNLTISEIYIDYTYTYRECPSTKCVNYDYDHNMQNFNHSHGIKRG